MKKIIVIMLIFIVLVISFWWVFHYISRDGEFTKWSHATVGIEHFEVGNAIYLDYHFRWEGIGSPTLEKVEFIKRDGTIQAKDDDEFRIHPFIATSERIGAVDEETVIKRGILNDLVEVKGFQVVEDFYLVLRVEMANTDNDISSVRITYKKFGVTQFQNIPFDDGIIKD